RHRRDSNSPYHLDRVACLTTDTTASWGDRRVPPPLHLGHSQASSLDVEHHVPVWRLRQALELSSTSLTERSSLSVPPPRLELGRPFGHSVSDCCVCQFHHGGVEGHAGVEPASSAWKAGVLAVTPMTLGATGEDRTRGVTMAR